MTQLSYTNITMLTHGQVEKQMGTYSRSIVLGRLGKDPELRYTSGGRACCHFSVATDRRLQDNDGNWRTQSNWHQCVVFGTSGEEAKDRLSKGDRVLLEGEHVTRSWEHAGVRHYKTELVCNRVEYVDSRVSEYPVDYRDVLSQ